MRIIIKATLQQQAALDVAHISVDAKIVEFSLTANKMKCQKERNYSDVIFQIRAASAELYFRPHRPRGRVRTTG